MAEFQSRLKELRKMHDLSQADLADALGVSIGLIGMYENGQRNPSKEKMEAIADYFNVSLDYLNGNDDGSIYYMNPKTAKIAQQIYEDKDMKILFDAAQDAKPEDLKLAADMLKRLKGVDDD